jgi:hypothetical protein
MGKNEFDKAENRMRELDLLMRQYNDIGNQYIQGDKDRDQPPRRPQQQPQPQRRPQQPQQPQAERQTGQTQNIRADYAEAVKNFNRNKTKVMPPRFENMNKGRGQQPGKPAEKKNINDGSGGESSYSSPPPAPAAPLNAAFGAPGIDGLLSGFNVDDEKLTVIFLIFLLIKSNADIKLVLALAYLLL